MRNANALTTTYAEDSFMSRFIPRLTAPTVDNKYYRYPGYVVDGVDGVNNCLLIDASTGAVMPNCVGYAWGRVYELLESRPALSQGDAYGWWSYADGYARGSDPQPGAVAYMQLASPGHVAIVERKVSNTEWIISESIYGGDWFRTGSIAYHASTDTWFCWYDDGAGGSYNPWDVHGFIYPPYEWDEYGTFRLFKRKEKKRRLIYV